MRSMTSRLAACLAISLCSIGCASDDGEEDAEMRTEALRPASTACITSDDCPYGHCSTADGACDDASSCAPGYPCAAVCYGVCVASPPAP